jgi:hypothetical protein
LRLTRGRPRSNGFDRKPVRHPLAKYAAGIFASIMPSVVPDDDRIELLEPRCEAHCRYRCPIADLGKEKATRVDMKAPELIASSVC